MTRALYDARLAHDCTLKDMIDDNGWKWPEEWFDVFPQICELRVPDLVPNKVKAANWDGIIEELSEKQNGNSIWSIIRRLCLADTVYHVWQERNCRLHDDAFFFVPFPPYCEDVAAILELKGTEI
ncbi:hypothetical protein Tco_0597779 [Tanacetum coccineum]